MPSLDDSYAVVVGALPAQLRAAARGLLHRLGVVSSPDGQWQELVRLHPNRELPVYAAEHDGGPVWPVERLRLFVRAHHCWGFWGMLRDRMADGQVPADPLLVALERQLAAQAHRSLAAACPDAAAVRRISRAAWRRWGRGIAREQALMPAGGVRPAAYASVVRDKLRWITAPSLCLLLGSEGAAPSGAQRVRARVFQRAHDLYLLALQAVDDVNDVAEDRAVHGYDVPGALGCSEGALLRVAPKLLGRAAAVAAAGGFSTLSFWLTAFRRAIAPLHRAGDQMTDELDAIAIAGEIEQATEDGR